MIITNVFLYRDDHTFKKHDIWLEGECIKSIREPGSVMPSSEVDIINGDGFFAIPGLVDIHMHGAAGHDFCDADEKGLQAIADFEASKGVLAICPATMSYNEDILNHVIDTAVAHKNHSGADLVGINMEGPFISPHKIGAQNPEYIMPCDKDMFLRLIKRSNGLIKLVDIAPEEPGALDFIKDFHNNIRISIAHTNGDYEIASAAFNMGACHMTHLFNAMPGIHHRKPGPIIAAKEALADVELIADGIHCHPAIIRFVFETFGAEKVVLISDSMMACGLPDGLYQLGGQSVTLKGTKCTLTDHPETIAGSAACLYDCMKNAIKSGVPIESAIRAASENPARCIGINKNYGKISPGYIGNIVLCDREMNIHSIIRHGSKL